MSRASLQLAYDITVKANEAWESGLFAESVTETTKNLLKYWFDPGYTELRQINFHEGQKQAILNTVYLHEVLKHDNIFQTYQLISPDVLLDKSGGISELQHTKYSHPKYCIKMATGTGKTFVLQALLIWQYLNAKHEQGNYSKNFLVVAPGLIVYERLLDAFLGKETENGAGRNFEQSDVYKLQELFIPEDYRDEIFGFLTSSVVKKEEIGTKVVGDGLVAITNWHLLAGVEDSEVEEETESLAERDPSQIVRSILPLRPGNQAGNSLDALDSQYGKGRELEYLKSLPNLVTFNDEAHHIHEVKKAGEQTEVEWQKSLITIAEPKGLNFIQIDFSATPFNQVGQNKIFFPHIIVDFDLKTAIQKGYVKTLVLDKRTEIATMDLDYKAVRDEEGKVIGLSEGQRVMLRAGLAKLKILEQDFDKISENHNKYPKMMIVCEDTKVVPFVTEFFKNEGLQDEDVLEIHSNKKGEVGKDEWTDIKSKLFNLDKHKSPKIVVSVLMLREGFDVSNICVIVPLRSSTAPILLEQTIGRGLRQMWREPEFTDIKAENRKRLLVEKKSPQNYLDILSIVEHPAFADFYKDLMEDGLLGTDNNDIETGDTTIGDIVNVGLKPNYKEYDIAFPIILSEAEEIIKSPELTHESMSSFHLDTKTLKAMIPKGERFVSEEMTKGARFGDYSISGGIMTATSYNEYVGRLVARVTSLLFEEVSGRHLKADKKFPALQVKLPELAALIDSYIRNKLFRESVDPLQDDNWRMLLIPDVSNFVIGQVSLAIQKMQTTETVSEAQVRNRFMSEIDSLRMRESYSLVTAKTIYERTPYPSNKGQFEKAFIEYCDADSKVEKFIKLLVDKHYFVRFRYIKDDGLMAYYYPDFIVETKDKIYIVETKAEDQINHPNVQKKRLSALNWIARVNALPVEKRGNKEWEYVIIGDTFFHDWRDKNASVVEMLEYAKLRSRVPEKVKGLFD